MQLQRMLSMVEGGEDVRAKTGLKKNLLDRLKFLSVSVSVGVFSLL